MAATGVRVLQRATQCATQPSKQAPGLRVLLPRLLCHGKQPPAVTTGEQGPRAGSGVGTLAEHGVHFCPYSANLETDGNGNGRIWPAELLQ